MVYYLYNAIHYDNDAWCYIHEYKIELTCRTKLLPLYSYARMYNTKLHEHSTVHPLTINHIEGGVAFQVLYQQRLTKHAWLAVYHPNNGIVSWSKH